VTDTYLSWVIKNTRTKWWHDSADEAELNTGLSRGAVGVTTNPLLAQVAITRNRTAWSCDVDGIVSCDQPGEVKAEALTKIAVTRAAERLLPEYERSGGESGYVCGQVNPTRASDRDCMYTMAQRYRTWAPNISVKLPATAAGLDVLEDCVADGINVTSTVSFTVPQVLAIAERHRKGTERAKASGIKPGKCFSVIMIGRLDDYLREVANDNGAEVTEADIRQSGLAVTKRAYQLYEERGYEAVLLVAALRGPYHLTELAGADVVMSIHPSSQDAFINQDYPREERIGVPVDREVIDRLSTMPEFVRAYEPDGMDPKEFVTFGATQRTLSQFCEMGWKLMETCR
jgi:transaldolase